jgi:hypothetical protein
MEALFRTIGKSKAMAILCLCCLNIIILGTQPSWGQVAKPKFKTEYEARKAVFDTAVYYSKIVREPSGKGMSNSHWAITKFNGTMKINPRSAYCSTFGIYCYQANGFKMPGINGMAYSWRKKETLVWHRGLLQIDRNLWPRIQLMDAVVCTWSHVEFVGLRNNGFVGFETNGITTVAGNTKGGLNRGEGVYFPVYRPFTLISGIYNNFTPLYKKL